MKKTRFPLFLAFLLGIIFTTQSVTVSAFTDLPNTPEVTVPEAQYNVNNTGDANYLAPVNSFDDNVTGYYLVTQDPARVGTTSVNYKGVDYPIKEVLVGNDLYNTKISGMSTGILNYNSATQNMTFFFDPGTYTSSAYNNYADMSKENMSFVGLSGNASDVIITKAAYPASSHANAVDCIERYNIAAPNMYFANITFDGTNKDLLPLGGNNIFGQASGVGKNRGEYFFFLTNNTAGFVMDNVTLQNIGKDTVQPGNPINTSLVRKNVAINFYRNSGQRNFIDVSIKNVKTKLGFGIVSFNQTKDNYFHNLTIDGVGAHAQSRAIKMEVMNNDTTALPIEANAAHFSGTVTLPTDSFHNHIYVQDYRYRSLEVPENWGFAAYLASNGGNFTYNSLVYENLPDQVTFGNDSVHAILDLRDNTWIVREGIKTPVSSQITTVLEVVAKLNADGKNSVPPANIKIIPDADGALQGFTVNLPSGVTNIGSEVHIFAEKTVDSPLTATDLIPLAADQVIELNLGAENPTYLHNFDFHSQASYTLHESTNGITMLPATSLTDPNEPLNTADYPLYASYYESKAPRVTNSSRNTFINSRFTVLTSAIVIQDKPATTPELQVGATMPLIAALAETNNAYTSTEFAAENGSSDDQSIAWFSSDPGIATVNPDTGEVTAVAPGTVTIFAKAKDQFNQGEIERPWDSLEIIVTDVLNLPYTVEYYLDGVLQPDLTESGAVPNNAPEVTSVPDKLTAGYELDTAQSSGLPYTVSATENVIKVYYKSSELPYTVRYYLDNEYQDTWDVSGTVLVNSPSVAAVTDKRPDGYELDTAQSTHLPFVVTDMDNVIHVYYIKAEVPVAELPYTVEYYFDGVLQEALTESGSVLETSPQVQAVINKMPTAYEHDLNQSSVLPYTVTTTDHVIKIYYTKVVAPTTEPTTTPPPTTTTTTTTPTTTTTTTTTTPITPPPTTVSTTPVPVQFGQLDIQGVLKNVAGEVLSRKHNITVLVTGPSFPEGKKFTIITGETFSIPEQLTFGEYRLSVEGAEEFIITLPAPQTLSAEQAKALLTVVFQEQPEAVTSSQSSTSTQKSSATTKAIPRTGETQATSGMALILLILGFGLVYLRKRVRSSSKH